MLYGVGALLVLALWVYCIVDCISSDETLIRNLPKVVWLFVVIILPTVGSIAWLALGRPIEAGFYPNQPRRTTSRPHPGAPRRARPPSGPEDSPEFMSSLEDQRLRAWEQDLRRREEEMRRREQDEPPDPTG